MRRVPVCEVTSEPSTWDPRQSGAGEKFRYIDISSIDSADKSILGAEMIDTAAAPSRARQIVRRDDVMVSTVRPNLNAVAIITADLDGSTASTGFAILRPDPEQVEARYLYHWVRSAGFVRHLTDRATGASYPAVTERVIRELRVPLPSLAEQRRIAALLDKADAIRRKGGRAPSVLDNLLRASYVHLVGEMHPAYAHWTECRIEDLADPRDGAMRTGPFGSALRHSEFSERGDVAVLGIDNAVSNRFRPGAPRFLSRERFENGLTRYAVNAYDVLITIMGTTGRSAVVPQGIGLAISTKHLATITVDRNRVAPEFLSHAIHCDPGVLRQIGAANRGAIMTGLNLRAIRRLKLRLPPIAAQERFAAVVARIRQIQAKCEQADNLSSTLVESLADASFRTSG